jgi:hypothetical protein
MKYTLSTVIIVLMACGVNARIIALFQGWDRLKADSQYIAVVSCGNHRAAKPNVWIEDATKSDSEIHIVFTLKGTNNVSSAHLLTDHELVAGQYYLVFGDVNNDSYCAYEEFRVVPLDTRFSTNSIVNLPFDQQVQTLLKLGLDKANRQALFDQEEKRRLESAFGK